MPKLKTHKSTSKRIKLTANRKLLRLKQKQSHKRSTKTKRVLRSFDKYLPVSPAESRRVRRLLGVKQDKA